MRLHSPQRGETGWAVAREHARFGEREVLGHDGHAEIEPWPR